MAILNPADFLALLPALRDVPGGALWSSYDREADVLYVNFRNPSEADDAELTDDDIIVRYAGEEVVGLTILHAGSR